jgi:hypothetical protein
MSEQPPNQEPPPDPPQPPAPAPAPAPGYAYPAPPQRPTAGNAVTALVLGILGLVMCGPFTAIPAIVVGRKATREIDESQGQLDGRGMAQAGFILGIVGTVVGGLALLFVIFVFVLGGVIASNFEGTCTTVDSDSSFTVSCD